MKSFLLVALLVSSITNIALAESSKTDAKKSITKKSAAKKSTTATKKVTKKDQNSNLGTSFSFDPASVRGKYKIASQGIATVEDEKLIDDLLGVRKSFKDREDQELSRR